MKIIFVIFTKMNSEYFTCSPKLPYIEIIKIYFNDKGFMDVDFK